MQLDRAQERITWAALGLLFAATIAVGAFPDPDMFHEMALIRQAIELGHLPLEDDFAYTPTRSPVVHHEWGTGAVLYCLTQLAGPAGILTLKYVIAAAIGLGVVIWRTAQSNVRSYRYGGNVRYMLQRTTGMIAMVFIIFHVYTMHRWGRGWFDPTDAYASAAAGVTVWRFLPTFYAVGVVCTVFHFANGIWTSLITWGITVGPNAQRRAGYACAVFGIMLGLVGLGALADFTGLLPVKPGAVTASTVDARAIDSRAVAEH